MATVTLTDPPSAAGPRPFVLGFDPVMMLAVLGLCACSLATLNTVTDIRPGYYMNRQAVYFAVGTVIALVLSRVDYSRLRGLKWGLYGFMLVSFVAVMAFGSVANGARRAIQLPFLSFQASELGKVLITLVLASFLVDRVRRLHDRDTTARTVLVALLPAAMVMVQPDLGSSLVYLVIVVAVLFVAGVSWRHFAALGTLGAVAITCVLVAAPAAGVEVLHDYQKDRLTSFLNPDESASREAYQQEQSKAAIGSGEKTGRGERATQTKYDFLPEHHTDFVFAVVGERWGFVGAAIVLSLYALLIWRGLRTLTVAKNLFGALLAGGIVAMLLFQVFINVGMTLGIMPITGIPLPLMSYGGSSVITTFIAIGLLQSVAAQGRAAAAGKPRVLAF
jgi:rod shape determining protein RodA